MARPKRTTLADAVAEMEAIKQRAVAAKNDIENIDDPIIAAVKLSDAIEEWRQKGAPDFVTKDPEYMRFIKTACREISTDILVTLKAAVEALHTKLQQVGLMIDPKDLSNIVGELGRQLKVMKDMESDQELPDNEGKLDDEIKKLRAELGIMDDETPTTGNA